MWQVIARRRVVYSLLYFFLNSSILEKHLEHTNHNHRTYDSMVVVTMFSIDCRFILHFYALDSLRPDFTSYRCPQLSINCRLSSSGNDCEEEIGIF
jgi:hypothetical protein